MNHHALGIVPARLLLPAPQRALLNRVLDVGKPTVVLLMAGSSIDLSAAQEKFKAIQEYFAD